MKTLMMTGAALALTASAAFAQDVIRMGTEGAYPPYNYIDDNGELAGFEIELGNELCARAELTCEWVSNDWDSIIPNLVSSNYDTIMAGMSITDERDEVIDFTQNYYPPTESAYVGASEEADFEGGVVAAQTATIQAAHVAEGGAALIEFATPEETVAAVRNGEADAVFADYDFLKPIVDASGGELMFVGDPVPLGGGIGMGLRESDTELKETFDTIIGEMKEDGTLNEMLVKWFGEEITTY
ncbi:polar amino acid transport system substrate-binding protein [Roseivivax halotolerans]|jgi:polar amino acid transport system substrate-binding protein|uniref:Polar amino acid transport system substrate-binding protein n=1 Tax=Roseivivax halotolerans TaxID=93684 RepID=A0A1I5XY10_9RHOB|nr:MULTISPECIES: transporter substrate-binding domain-containing protein [Roseivivax]QFT62245.1 Lysine-arginine-ornithine-binding periplasmic protein precursor [Roseivivax sp. THAF30]SFQ36796.1 polar amino acid transport system substrate-binding protein [Roseivivax halotolerans]